MPLVTLDVRNTVDAIQLREPGSLQLIDLDEPSPPDLGEALVRVHRVGLCGTDIAGYRGTMPYFSYPRIPGHELGVEVLAVAPDVHHIKPGDRCCIEPYINNPESFASKRGHGNCCNELQTLGVHIDGGLRPLFKLPARKLHESESLDYEQLALVEPLAIGCHAIDRAQPIVGEHLLVIGAGPIGLSVMEFARQEECRVTVLDHKPERLEFCREHLHVDYAVQAGEPEEVAAQLAEITSGNLFPIVVDATGNAESMSTALEYVGHTGKLVCVGITSGHLQFAYPLLHRPEMTIMASRNALPGDFARIIRLLEDDQLDITPWITHRVPFANLIGEFESLIAPDSGRIKAIVELGKVHSGETVSGD